jgi:hypothetical protein
MRRRKNSAETAFSQVYSHWSKDVETDSVDRLAKSLTAGSKNLEHILETLAVAPRANTA